MLGGQGYVLAPARIQAAGKITSTTVVPINAHGTGLGLGYINSSRERHTKRRIQKDGRGFDRLDGFVATVVNGNSGLCVFDCIPA